jgi:glycosyltransferase involved in cell wall biosynthesis
MMCLHTVRQAHGEQVAVLMPTYNGSRFVESQLRSLRENSTPFTLHWLDDHSSDNTRDVVRLAARSWGITVKEWHQNDRQGIPGAFFQLLECVEADIYLFCDQDDIWQAGKIDATVRDLLPDSNSPVLCFSDPFVFTDDKPAVLHRLSDITSVKGPEALRRWGMFLICPAIGHTIGFTRPLRDIFLEHKDIARRYAAGQDTWMYLLAAATGTCRFLGDAPTTLYRLHGGNAYGSYFRMVGWRSLMNTAKRWRLQQALRRWVSRQAQGFCLAANTLPPGPELDRMLGLAALVLKVDRRQSPAALLRLARRDALPPGTDFALWFAATCLSTNANTRAQQVAFEPSPRPRSFNS